MIRHVVMWKFRAGTEEKQEEFLNGLSALFGVIPQIRAREVRRDAGGGENWSAMLISDFDSLEDLKAYKKDPRHQAVSALCRSIREDRAAVDWEI